MCLLGILKGTILLFKDILEAQVSPDLISKKQYVYCKEQIQCHIIILPEKKKTEAANTAM